MTLEEWLLLAASLVVTGGWCNSGNKKVHLIHLDLPNPGPRVTAGVAVEKAMLLL